MVLFNWLPEPFLINSKRTCFAAFRPNTERYYSLRMRENTDQKNSEYGHVSHNAN